MKTETETEERIIELEKCMFGIELKPFIKSINYSIFVDVNDKKIGYLKAAMSILSDAQDELTDAQDKLGDKQELFHQSINRAKYLINESISIKGKRG